MKRFCAWYFLQKRSLQLSFLQNGREGGTVGDQRKQVSLRKNLGQSFDHTLAPSPPNEPVMDNGDAELRQLCTHGS